MLALVQAYLDLNGPDGLTERGVCNFFAAIIYGRPVPTPENFKKWAAGQAFEVGFDLSRNRLRGRVATFTRPGADWIEKDAFRPFADGIRIKLRRFRGEANSSPNRRWLAAMSKAWRICLCGDMRRLNFAEHFAAAANELHYFRAKMLPTCRHSFSPDGSPPKALTPPELLQLI